MHNTEDVLWLQDCLAAFQLFVSDGMETALHWYPAQEAFVRAHQHWSLAEVEMGLATKIQEALQGDIAQLIWE